MPAKAKPKPKGGASPRRQFVVDDERIALLDRIAVALSPDYPPSRSVVVREAIDRMAEVMGLSPPARRS
jgi:hypothetical protein